jgi:hypothetical protein
VVGLSRLDYPCGFLITECRLPQIMWQAAWADAVRVAYDVLLMAFF